MKIFYSLLPAAMCAILTLFPLADGALAQNIQFQPRPPFQNQPSNPCAKGPIRLTAWTRLGSVDQQGGERADVYVNDTTIQAVNYATRNGSVLFLKMYIQLRAATGAPVSERILLDGRGRFASLTNVSEGALRQNVDNYLDPIPPKSAYALVEQHLREARCF
jgi:hypothetical protein